MKLPVETQFATTHCKDSIAMILFKRYGLRGMMRLLRDVIITRIEAMLIWKSSVRLIRRPVYIQGKSHISLGRNFTSGIGMRLDAAPVHGNVCLEIGDNVQINDYVHIGAINSIKIGKNVLIASKVFITDHDHGSYGRHGRHDSPLSVPKDRELSFSFVTIEDNVWIGEFVAILPGVTVGKGSIIGAMSVVTRDIPPNCIAVGAPAKVVKKYDFETARWEAV
jgi:lipopolysaccharide O-acetyltransferase